ncbi:glutamate-1-semialdehyde 2,1-aminomutase [Methanosalsum natronophilum]|uniref:Glutamate-1-semialdehyde 2,1-aminomutase n=1 Tax=Methanosalsum natronophilum TaxID=768733 RepID=A0A424Z493_9EURY|nr:glutamate-1-semialdehyde 2,1-aminomutase [Methanosalsum natronophilum]MCS3923387.1 glutamate-1-semialdehyde 2,1-aminomutase [Methanosalsum natronophilum]RQD91910.1 MAG: glutamate-1-semialdehyde-2,1-aminomutase [Methanosalsum natronophilum]
MSLERSEEMFNKAKSLLPGGVSSPVRAIKPYPFYTESASGSIIRDVDGNEYIDYCMGYGPNIFGHGDPDIKRAIIDQLDKGWLYGTPIENEYKLATRISDLYPSIDMLRFVSTGTEATMSALRAARGFTGKDKFIKIEGGFHGAHDAVLVQAGSGATTHGKPDSLGVPESFTRHTLQVPYNDIESLVSRIESNKDEVAALIMEPVMGNIGPILPDEGYLEEVRKVTEENDILLIFDEVITGFRLAMGGAQEFYGVTPDMTTLGKIVGGGLPIGVFGGKREIMEKVSPSGGIYQAGTFSGSPAVVTAGLAVIDKLESENVHENLNTLGDEVRVRLAEIVQDLNLNYSVSGIASMFKIFFSERPSNYQDIQKCDKQGYVEFFKRMLNDGIFLPPAQFETNFLSTCHTREEIETTIQAYESNLK